MNFATKQPATISSCQVLSGVSVACREVGKTIAEIEDFLIDAHQGTDASLLPRKTLQSIDLVIQSLEEIALVVDRLKAELPPQMAVTHAAVLAPARLEWIQTTVSGEDAPLKPDDEDHGAVSLF